jgi:hypothetical protein
MGAGNSVRNTERSKALRWTQEKIGSRAGIPFQSFLTKAVAAKSGKRYGAPCWLVVYLNISEYGIRQKETEAAISQIKASYASSFEAISVLWKGRLY